MDRINNHDLRVPLWRQNLSEERPHPASLAPQFFVREVADEHDQLLDPDRITSCAECGMYASSSVIGCGSIAFTGGMIAGYAVVAVAGFAVIVIGTVGLAYSCKRMG